ncbi:hypothetical protein G9A89_005489 [Geosiphon pyriformis]|nr:hypothetical protein G9A89_005489 [Geosiphon pyriformis]
MRSDWTVVIKELPMNTSKDMIVAVVSEFGKIKSIKIQLIGIWQKAVLFLIGKNSVYIVKAVEDHEIWALRDQFRALLFTLPVRTTAHNLGTLLKRAGEKTCIINKSLETGNRIRCVVVGFESDNDLESAFHMEPILSGIKLFWARMDLVQYKKYGKFGHSALECDASVVSSSKPSKTFKKVVSDECHLQLAKLYEKKYVPVVSLAGSSDGFHFASGSGSPLSGTSDLNDGFPSVLVGNSSLDAYLAFLEQSLELSMELVSLVSTPSFGHSVVPIVVNVDSDLNMVLNGSMVVPATPSIVSALGFNSSKILTTKMDCLESKLVALEASIGSVLVKLDQLCIGLGGLVWKFAVCNVHDINVPAKQIDVVYWHANSGNMVFFFKSVHVFISGLDKGFFNAGIAIIINNSLACHVSKIKEISGRIISVRLLFKDKLSVTILGLYTGASFETRFGQALEVNSLIAEAVNSSTFVVLGRDFNKNRSGRSATFKFCLGLGLSNLWGVEKTIDFIFVCSVSGFFDTDHSAVLTGFRDCLSAKLLVVANKFFGAETHSNVNAMWAILKRVIVELADKTFSRQWFNEFHCSRNKFSSKFFGLKLLVAKIVKKFVSGDLSEVDCLVKTWSTLDSTKACVFANLIGLDGKSKVVLGHLLLVCKEYRRSKMYESKVAEKASIKLAILKCMKNFCSDKGSMIRSVLDWPSHKVEVKLNVNKIIEDWIRKQVVFLVYAPLNYVQDCAFSNVMGVISSNELLLVVNDLPDGKAAGLSDIPNELWKCGSNRMLGYFLRLLNACLLVSGVPVLVLTNTQPIALIETARKILSKILSDRIFSVYSKFGVLQGDNFSVLKSTSIQSLVFTIGSVENALEKDWELWLVFQNIHKTYDSVGFIRFFGGIHSNRINRVMTDFSLTGRYRVWNGLDQGERIFYDSLLRKVKRHKHLCGYQIDTKFVARTVSNYQTSMQYALNIASKFFAINDISINNKKTSKAHRYLGIFLSTEGLFKSSVIKVHSDVCFFVNVMLRKVIINKQFFYLVVTVLQPIKGFRSKAHLSHDFPVKALHHFLLYGLKSFQQLQLKCKSATVVSFFNALGIFGHLFNHKFLDLQVLDWAPLNPLQFSVKLRVSLINNFLVSVVKIFLDSELSLANNLPSAFYNSGVFLIFFVLKNALYFSSKELLNGLEDFSSLEEFVTVLKFLMNMDSLLTVCTEGGLLLELNVLNSVKFSNIQSSLHKIWSSSFDIYTDSLLRDVETAGVTGGTAAYFFFVNLSVGVKIQGLLFSTLSEFQAVALALKCIPSSCTVVLHLNSQAAIDACVSEMFLAMPDFCSYSGVTGNVVTDAATSHATCSKFSLLIGVCECFLVTEAMAVFDNTHHFIRDAGPDQVVVLSNMVGCVDWSTMAKIWHPDFYMFAGFTSQESSGLHTYLMKAVHQWLPVAVRKRLYNRRYPGMLCLLCSKVELLDHVFTCALNAGIWGEVLTFSQCSLDVGLYSVLYKRFMLRDWCEKAVNIFDEKKEAFCMVVGFVKQLANLVSGLSCCIRSVLSEGMIKILGIIESFAVNFGH